MCQTTFFTCICAGPCVCCTCPDEAVTDKALDREKARKMNAAFRIERRKERNKQERLLEERGQDLNILLGAELPFFEGDDRKAGRYTGPGHSGRDSADKKQTPVEKTEK